MNIIQLIKEGLLSIADPVIEGRDYHYPAPGGFIKDKANLSGDIRLVGQGMRKSINNYGGKQSHKRQSTR